MNTTKLYVVVFMLLILGVVAGCVSNAASPPKAVDNDAEVTSSVDMVQTQAQQAEPVIISVDRNAGDLSSSRELVVDRGLSEVAKECIDCHKTEDPGIINDWKNSRHGHVGVSCLDCHQVESDSPMATQHESIEGTDVYISVLVPPSTCASCHPVEVEQFNESGHIRAYRQIIPNAGLNALIQTHEGRDHPEFGNASGETGCMQCHGTEIKLDEDKRPISSTWPNMGMGSVYPNDSVGNCATCHTRHKFSIAEARKPNSCASCHLGPDHPNIEIFENSKHGHVFMTDSDDWNWESAPDAWEPGDYRGPTCATCHMSGIGELETTHNITERLYWNLWAKSSGVRNSSDVMSGLLGDGEKGRAKMEMVCNSCHTPLHTTNFFEQGDKAVKLYNEAYYAPALKMLEELKEKGLLKDNPWTDEFQRKYYYLWHHDGRRARQGAMMGAPDYAHWHGFFELQQLLYDLEAIHEKRISTGTID